MAESSGDEVAANVFGADAGPSPELVACIQQIVADAMRSNSGGSGAAAPTRTLSPSNGGSAAGGCPVCVCCCLSVYASRGWWSKTWLSFSLSSLFSFLLVLATVPSLCSYPPFSPFIVGQVCDPGSTCAEGGVTPSMCRGWSYPLHGQRGIYPQSQAPMCHCRPRVCW